MDVCSTFSTPDADVWRICITPDRKSVLVLSIDRLVGLKVHEATGEELQRLARTYPFVELREMAHAQSS